MSVNTAAVGSSQKPFETTVSARSILAYAAGLGNDDPVFLDDASASPLTATDPFCVALEWPMLSDSSSRALLGLTADESRQAVHASQDTVFHAPIKAGQRLTVTGEIVGIDAIKAGARVQSVARITDTCSGMLLTESWLQSIYRGVALNGESKVIATAPAIASKSSELRSLAPIAIPIAREFPHIYSECSGIWNPIHTERRIALDAGLPDIIVHGTALWALCWKAIRSVTGNRIERLTGRFSAMVVPGTVVSLTIEQAPHGRDVFFTLSNEAGQPAISHGYARLGSGV